MVSTMLPPYVLLAESDQQEQSRFREFFKRKGWNFDVAATAASALNAIGDKKYDVIIADLVMPDLPGIDLIRSLRLRDPERVIMVVGQPNSEELLADVLREGAVNFITKPVDFGWIGHAVEDAVAAVRRSEFEHRIYRHVVSERGKLLLTCKDVDGLNFKLPIVTKLYDGGIIDLSTKLKIELAFQEAFINGLEHGNLGLRSEWKEELDGEGIDRFSKTKAERLDDPQYADRTLTISWAYDGEQLVLGIKDCGKGFLSQVGDMANGSPEVSACYGRGMALISGSVDQIAYHDGGSEIILTKKINPK